MSDGRFPDFTCVSLQLLPLDNFLRSSPRPPVDLYVIDSESPAYLSLPELPGALTRFVTDEKVHTCMHAILAPSI